MHRSGVPGVIKRTKCRQTQRGNGAEQQQRRQRRRRHPAHPLAPHLWHVRSSCRCLAFPPIEGFGLLRLISRRPGAGPRAMQGLVPRGGAGGGGGQQGGSTRGGRPRRCSASASTSSTDSSSSGSSGSEGGDGRKQPLPLVAGSRPHEQRPEAAAAEHASQQQRGRRLAAAEQALLRYQQQAEEQQQQDRQQELMHLKRQRRKLKQQRRQQRQQQQQQQQTAAGQTLQQPQPTSGAEHEQLVALLQQAHLEGRPPQQQQQQQQQLGGGAVVAEAPPPAVPDSVSCARPASLASAAGTTWARVTSSLPSAASAPQQPVAQVALGVARLEITRVDLGRLRPGCWLNDEVVNFYGALVQARSDALHRERCGAARAALQGAGGGGGGGGRPGAPLRRLAALPAVHVFSSFFFQALAVGPSGRYCYAAVRRWTLPQRTRTPGCVLACRDLLLFPINLDNEHWALAAVWPRRGLLRYYDSAGAASGSPVLSHLAAWLQEDAADKGCELPEGPLRRELVRSGMPRQGDGSSCGVFACATMERLAAGWGPPFDFSQADVPALRVGMAMDILRARLD